LMSKARVRDTDLCMPLYLGANLSGDKFHTLSD